MFMLGNCGLNVTQNHGWAQRSLSGVRRTQRPGRQCETIYEVSKASFYLPDCVKRCIKKDPSICLLSIQNAMKQSVWPCASEIQHWNFYSTSRCFALFGGSLTARCCRFGKEFFMASILVASSDQSLNNLPRSSTRNSAWYWYNMIQF